MLQTQSENVMVSTAQVGRGLIGHWAVDMKPPVRKRVVSTGSELGLLDTVGGQRLIWVWSLQSEFVA